MTRQELADQLKAFMKEHELDLTFNDMCKELNINYLTLKAFLFNPECSRVKTTKVIKKFLELKKG